MGMNRKAIFCALVGAALLACPAAAWAESDEQIWTTLGASVKLTDQWRLSQDVVIRLSEGRDGLYEIESSTLLGYKLGKNVTLAAGYVHSPQYSGGDFTRLEQRAREQLSFDNVAQFGKAKLSLRLRAEQRWREGFDGTGWRLRPYAKLAIPLQQKAQLNLSNETFVNINRTDFQRTRGVDRMRNLITVSLPITKVLTGEAGYMNQHGFVPNGPDTSDNIGFFALSLSL